MQWPYFEFHFCIKSQLNFAIKLWKKADTVFQTAIASQGSEGVNSCLKWVHSIRVGGFFICLQSSWPGSASLIICCLKIAEITMICKSWCFTFRWKRSSPFCDKLSEGWTKPGINNVTTQTQTTLLVVNQKTCNSVCFWESVKLCSTIRGGFRNLNTSGASQKFIF